MADIDSDPTWDDSFNFVGVTFASTTSTGVSASATGAVATSPSGNNTAYASWFTSTTPVTSFSLNYLTTGGLTHAYLAYALKVFLPCPIPLATLNVSVNNPIVCQGTPANVIATPSISGTYNYTWTVPSGATNPGNVASFFTNVAGVYSVIITNTGTGVTSPSASGTVTINTPVPSTFNTIPAICNGVTAPSLPSISIEGFTGSWLPNIVSNTQTANYTFTPTAGQCAAQGSVTVAVNDIIAPTFNTFGPYCTGSLVPSLPTTSNNSISGTWSPATINNTLSGNYTYTPTSGSCNSLLTITITINSSVTPTFDAIPTLCYGSPTPSLPTTSNNSITGTWSPAIIDNTQSASYIFTPNAGQCASSTTKDVTVIQITTPTFLSPAPICTGNTAPTLPLTSLNGITGTWSPSIVDNTQTATYTFTPNSGQCASTTTMSVTVYQDCSFGSFANAVWLTNCEDNDFFNTVGSGTSIIGPAQNIFPNTDFGTYISNSNTFKLRGAEVKTFKSATANVCSARLNYRIYPQAGTPGVFAVLNLPFFDNCSGGSFLSGGPCNPGDQKWQKVLSNAEFPVDLTAFPAGDYVLEVYYDITGDVNSTTQCDDTIYINNNGNNFIATYTLQESPTYTSVNPTICNAADGSITIESLAPSTTYTITYTHDSAVVGPLTINTNSSGQYTLSGLTVGTYANFNYEVNGCTFASTDVITLTVQSPALITSTDPLTCNGYTGTITISNLVPNQTYAVSYLDGTALVGPTTMTSDASGQIILNGLNAGVYTNFSLTTTYCTATSVQVATLVDPAPPVVTVNSSTICTSQSTTITATPQVPGSYNYLWTVPSGFTNPGNVASFNTNVGGTYTVVISPIGTSFCNGDFENPTTTGAFPNPFDESIVNCWDTTAADGIFEFWPPAGFEGIFAYQGNQFIEINGNSTATVFQDFTTYPGANLQISFAHRGRQGNDVVGVEIGPNGGPYTSLGNFTDSNTAWALHNLNYLVPSSGGNNYTIRFVSVSSTGGDPSVGNFLDAVSVTSAECNSASASGTVTLLPVVTLSLTSANNNQTVCINTPITAISYTSINATDVTVTGLPTGVNGSFDSGTNVFTISGTPTQSGTFAYTVSTVGGCNLVTLNGTIVVNPTVTATFTPITICRGDAVTLPLTSLESYTGTWNPATADNTQTGTYTFTPTAGQCATSGSLTITVNQPTPSTFTTIPAICNGDPAPALPGTSLEGFTGTWLPNVVSNTLSGTYTFTPTTGQCASAGAVSITVNQKTTPTFNAIAALCTGEIAPSLPSASIEGITGTWTPAQIDNTTSGSYTFVPDAGQCANNGSISVTVQSAFDFELSGKCVGDNFILEVTAVNNTIDVNTASFVWYNSNGQAVGNNSSTFNVTEYLNSTEPIEELPITFTVTVTNTDGCYKTEPITLVRIFCGIQKGISVNNDGLNEFFDLTLLNVRHLTIFNRYGMKVYTKGGYTNQWKGQSDNGDELPDGTYYYVIDFNDNLPAKTGWIYINREN